MYGLSSMTIVRWKCLSMSTQEQKAAQDSNGGIKPEHRNNESYWNIWNNIPVTSFKNKYGKTYAACVWHFRLHKVIICDIGYAWNCLVEIRFFTHTHRHIRTRSHRHIIDKAACARHRKSPDHSNNSVNIRTFCGAFVAGTQWNSTVPAMITVIVSTCSRR